MIACRWFLLLMLVLYSSVTNADGRAGVTLLHFEPVDRLVIANEGANGVSKPGVIGAVRLSFDTLGRSFDLDLEPNASLLAAIPADRRGSVVPYRGQIAGVADSWARLVIADGVPAGLIWDGAEIIAIEPPGNNIAGSPGIIGFRLSDVVIEPGALSCASGGLSAKTGAEVYKAIVDGAVGAFAPGAVEEINIGAVGDFEAFGVHGGSTQAEILARLGNVDGIYSQQVGVQINVPFIEIFSDANDPFTDETVAGLLLNEVAAYRFVSTDQRAQGLTHLYTGRDLDGTTAGVAFVGVLCQPSAGSGLSEISNSPTIDSLIAAHEIGHNFGADHDGDINGSCPSAPLNHIMAPSVNPNNDTFSACSVGVMQLNAAAALCVTPLPSTDISVAFADPDSTVLLSNAFQVTADVTNMGTDDAVNVVANISLPTNVSFVDATGATCANGAGSVSCQLGTVAGGSAMSIVVSTDTVAVGSDSFDATVVADADDRPSNNQDSLQLTVDPAVNLVVNALSTVRVDVDSSTNISVTLENLSTLDATNVTLSLSLNAGLQANSASWSIGTCSVTAQQVDCQANLFANQSSSTLNFNVTGLATGNKGYAVSLASAETDADTSDNSANGTVTVSAPQKESDGGGSFGWLLLGILFGTRALFGKRALNR